MPQITVRESINQAIKEEMLLDPNVFIMGEEVAEYQGAYKITQGLLQEFGPNRVVDTPISEHAFAGIAIGAAFTGLKPIIEFMSFNFSLQAMDQIINSAAKTHYMSNGQLKCPIVFRGPNGAAAQVAAQHSQCFAAWYAHIPGLKVIAPYFADDFKGLLKSAIRDPNPVIFLENEISYGLTHDVDSKVLEDDYLVPIGKSRIVKEGNDLTIVTFSIYVKYAIEAAQILADEHGVDVEIIDLRTIKPLDFESIKKSLEKTNKLITVEEGFPVVSFGSEISARVMEEAFDLLDAPILRVAAKDIPLPYAKNLEKLALPSIENIIETALKVVKFKI
jgi:pyruvate dehydrogenase E1 component beta subunit